MKNFLTVQQKKKTRKIRKSTETTYLIYRYYRGVVVISQSRIEHYKHSVQDWARAVVSRNGNSIQMRGHSRVKIYLKSHSIFSKKLYNHNFTSFFPCLKVSKSRKQIMVPWILPKNERNSLSWTPSVLRIVSSVHFLEKSRVTIFYTRFTDLYDTLKAISVS